MGTYNLEFTPYRRRNPLTGEIQSHIRTGNARQTSRGLKNFQACVRRNMQGKCFTDPNGDARKSSQNVTEALTAVANACETNPDATGVSTPTQTDVCSS
jgi:hypothetical protein